MSERNGNVLIVDDDPDVGKVIEALLVQAGISCRWVPDVDSALAVLRERPMDVVITDLRMPGASGLDLLEEIVERWPEIPVVLLTAHATLDVAVEASIKGAADFLRKPFDREEVLFTVRKQLGVSRYATHHPTNGVKDAPTESASPKMRAVEDLIRRAAAGNFTVILRGENGTGKDVAAQAIHRGGPRQAEPFVRVHCAAFPETLIESELFGYERGAFNGAASRRFGRVEIAGRGTLFLDEIGDVSLPVQVKLLRLLQEREFERLGSSQTLKTPARFIAATHQPLEELIERGKFREDLFFRLKVLEISDPTAARASRGRRSVVAPFLHGVGPEQRAGRDGDLDAGDRPPEESALAGKCPRAAALHRTDGDPVRQRPPHRGGRRAAARTHAFGACEQAGHAQGQRGRVRDGADPEGADRGGRQQDEGSRPPQDQPAHALQPAGRVRAPLTSPSR